MMNATANFSYARAEERTCKKRGFAGEIGRYLHYGMVCTNDRRGECIFGQNALWVTAISFMIFFVGLLLNLLKDVEKKEEFFYALGLATIGVFVIPAIFPQFNLLCGIAEISGTAIGLTPRLIWEILEHLD